MRARSGLLLLFVIATLGPGCSDRRVEEERASKPPPVVAEFVPLGPVRTEEEAIAATWRYTEAHAHGYLTPPRENEDIRMTIDPLQGASVGEEGPDSTLWRVRWELQGSPLSITAATFYVDKATGQVRPY